MNKLDLVLVLLSIGLINCEHFDHVKGGHLKGPGFWASYKAKVVELPSPTIEHVAPVHQRLVVEEKTHHPIQERLVVQEKVHHVEPVRIVQEKVHHVEPARIVEKVHIEQPRVVEQVREEHHERIIEAPRVIEKVHVERPRIIEKVHHVEPARIVEKVHVEQPRIIEQVRVEHHPQVVEQVRVEEAVKGGITKHHQDIVLQDHHDLHHERRHEELHQQREQLNELKEIQHFQQIHQHEQIKQQLEQQRHLEQVVQTVERPAQIVEGKTVQHIEQIVQQKQQRNEKLTDEEEAIAEPFPLIPKTSFTCDDKPILPGYYSDIETGCRVYHFCFARAPKVDVVEQVHHGDHRLQLLVHHLPQPEQQQMKSFFCGQGTLFNQKLLICDHEVNVNCPESIHFYGANIEFGKPSAEPAAQLVQQKEITKTNIVQVREPVIVQVKENIVQQPEPVIVQHHDAIKIVEPPRPIVQVKEQIVQHPEPVKIVQRVETARLVEEPVIVQQKNDIHTTTNKLVHEDRISTSTHTDAGSFASSSELHPNWKEDRSWSTSRTLWGSNNTSSRNETATTTSNNESTRLNSDAEWSSSSSTTNERSDKLQLQNKPKNRRFLGELITTNIPNTSFTCEKKPFEGFYADVETSCKIYHQCLNGRKSTYLCSRGTLFDQKTLSCNFEEKVKCSDSEQYYTSNIEFN